MGTVSVYTVGVISHVQVFPSCFLSYMPYLDGFWLHFVDVCWLGQTYSMAMIFDMK